jgi:hypothetical protein
VTADLITRLRAALDEIEGRATRAAWRAAATLATADRKDGDWVPPYDGTHWGSDYDHIFAVDTRPSRGRAEKIADCGASAFGLTPHIATHDPAHVLADIAAKRKILDLHQQREPGWCSTCDVPSDVKGNEAGCPTVLALAEAYGITE